MNGHVEERWTRGTNVGLITPLRRAPRWSLMVGRSVGYDGYWSQLVSYLIGRTRTTSSEEIVALKVKPDFY
jgi:hypothetical protein